MSAGTALPDGGPLTSESSLSRPVATVNGRAVPLTGVPVHTTALDWLRGAGLTGAKEGCAEGECGACSVLVARPARAGLSGAGSTTWTALNACLVPALALDGQEVVTAEGLGTPQALHPVQAEIAERGGSQCGYCTPGFVCSMAAEYYRADRTDRAPTDRPHAEHGPNGFDLHAIAGNLCRCTGYRPLRDAAWALGHPDRADPLAVRRARPAPDPSPTRVRTADGEYVRPTTLASALELLAQRPDAVVVAGSTDHGVEVNLRGARPALTIALDRLAELRRFEVTEHHVDVGAALSLTEVEDALGGALPLLSEMVPRFASRLVRNAATLGGNLGTASPIGDAAPVLLALDASLVLVSAAGERTVPLSGYFTGYRASVREAGELVAAVRVPLPVAPVASLTKITKRRFDDISSVAVAIALDVVPDMMQGGALNGDRGVVRSVRIGLGGVAATPIRALATEAALTGATWDAAGVAAAADVLAREGPPLDDHRASAAYRSAMLRQALLRLHAEHPGAGAGAGADDAPRAHEGASS